MNKNRRQIPTDLRPRFIQLLKGFRRESGTLDEDTLWEVTARLLHAELMNEWEHFKDDIGIYGSEDIVEDYGDLDLYDDSQWGGML